MRQSVACRLLIQNDSDSLDGVPSKKEWERLAALMRRRRVALNPAWHNRARFFRDNDIDPKGGPARTIQDLETCARQNFERGSLDLVEHYYKWQAGSIAAVLRGGDPMPDEDDVDVRDERSPLSRQRAELHRLIDLIPEQDIPRVHGYLTGIVEQL